MYKDQSRVEHFVKAQLALKRSEHSPVIVNSIGMPLFLNDTTTKFYKSGSEVITLHNLWEYCKIHADPKQKVVYLHSKGSFHATPENDKLRMFISRGALSKECATLPSTCNVCSSRMSPIPHPHTSGNMWLARCDYISRLMDPILFGNAMKKIAPTGTNCRGVGRFAAEHWVHSHPQVRPCDLHIDKRYVWNYSPLPDGDFIKDLQPAPRYSMAAYIFNQCGKNGQLLQQRLNEYDALYQEKPPQTWWGWQFFMGKNNKSQLNQ